MKSYLVSRFTWLVLENRGGLAPVEMEYYVPYDAQFIIASQNDTGSYKLLDVYSNKYRRVVRDYGMWTDTRVDRLRINSETSILYQRLDMNQTSFNIIKIAIFNTVSLDEEPYKNYCCSIIPKHYELLQVCKEFRRGDICPYNQELKDIARILNFRCV